MHEQDLESGLYYSLWWEVKLHKVYEGTRLTALKTYIHHLAEVSRTKARAPLMCLRLP